MCVQTEVHGPTWCFESIYSCQSRSSAYRHQGNEHRSASRADGSNWQYLQSSSVRPGPGWRPLAAGCWRRAVFVDVLHSVECRRVGGFDRIRCRNLIRVKLRKRKTDRPFPRASALLFVLICSCPEHRYGCRTERSWSVRIETAVSGVPWHMLRMTSPTQHLTHKSVTTRCFLAPGTLEMS